MSDDKDPEPSEGETASADSSAAEGAETSASGAGSAGDDSASKTGAAADEPAGDRMDLPKWNRARVKRKQAKGEEQDAFQKGVRQAGRQALTQAPVVLGLIVIVAGLIAGAVWWSSKREEDRATATRILQQAVAFRARAQVVDVEAFMKDRKRPFPIPLVNDEDERAQKVTEALEQLEQEAPDSAAAEAAQLVQAARAMQQRDFEQAVQGYRGFAQENPDHELVFLAHEGVVLALEAQGDLEAALAATQELIGNPGDFYRDQGLWQKGRLLEAQGKSEQALEVYEQYVEEFPLDRSSMAQQQVKARLQELAPELVPAEPEQPGLNMPGLGIQ